MYLSFVDQSFFNHARPRDALACTYQINHTYDGSIPNLINDLLVAEMWSNLANLNACPHLSCHEHVMV